MEIQKFQDLKIRDPYGEEFSLEEFLQICKSEYKRGLSMFIGSDSQKFFNKVNLVTSVCMHHPSKGAQVFYVKQKVRPDMFPSLRSRMMAELYCSLETAFYMKEMIGCDIEVHLDIGSDPKKCKTFPFKKEFLNIVRGQGFVGRAKPESWASGVADWFTKS